MSNSNEFLSTFNKLEHYLKDQLDDGSHRPFYSLISNLKHSNSNVRHYYIKLKEYGDLRNAIVHERIDGRIIAEPNDFAVEEFKMIYEKVTKPLKIVDICTHSVKTLTPENRLSEGLGLMSMYGFSQVPIYNDNGFVAMLNSVAISTWLGKIMSSGCIDASGTKISEVLDYKRKSRVTLFKTKNIDVYEILELYREYAVKTNRIDAIIVTESGKSSEKPITIITEHDILKISESV